MDFAGPVTLTTSNADARLLEIALANCTLRSGLQHDIATSTDPYDILYLTLSGCTVRQGILAHAAVVAMHADTIDAGATFRVEESITVSACWFRGGLNTALDITGAEPLVIVADNLIETYGTGITVLESRQLTMRNNVIRHVAAYGAYVRGAVGTLLANAISDCGTGLRCSLFKIDIGENAFLRNRGTALWLDGPDSVRADRNIFAHSGDFGMVIGVGYQAYYRLTQNTFVHNRRSGLSIPPGVDNSLLLEANLLVGNSEWGLVVPDPKASVTLRCNDWYANGLGPAFGTSVSHDDFSVDPLFCDSGNDDFHLYSDSPLLAQVQCTQIGARGIGCSPPMLKGLSVGSNRAGLGVAWEFEAASTVECWLERADQSAGPWDSLGTGTPTASNSFVLLDTAVAPDIGYHYRVAWMDRGRVVRGSPVSGTWTDAGRLSSVTPNPAIGLVRVEWVLSHAGATDIRVFDLAGREVSVIARGEYGVGRHQARWDGRLDGGGSAPAGMYLVRVSTGNLTASHRILFLR